MSNIKPQPKKDEGTERIANKLEQPTAAYSGTFLFNDKCQYQKEWFIFVDTYITM